MPPEPKDTFIGETRSLTEASRTLTQPKEVVICGESIVVYPRVFDPGVFFSSCWFGKMLAEHLQSIHAASFCEIGCGTGIVSLLVAKSNPALPIEAGDITKEAVTNTTENFRRHGVLARVIETDVFSGFENRKFDAIFWSLPFGYLAEEESLDIVDRQTFDPGYRAIRKYFAEGAQHLSKRGELLFGFSPEIGHLELIEEYARMYGWRLQCIGEHRNKEVSEVTVQLYSATV